MENHHLRKNVATPEQLEVLFQQYRDGSLTKSRLGLILGSKFSKDADVRLGVCQTRTEHDEKAVQIIERLLEIQGGKVALKLIIEKPPGPEGYPTPWLRIGTNLIPGLEQICALVIQEAILLGLPITLWVKGEARPARSLEFYELVGHNPIKVLLPD